MSGSYEPPTATHATADRHETSYRKPAFFFDGGCLTVIVHFVPFHVSASGPGLLPPNSSASPTATQ